MFNKLSFITVLIVLINCITLSQGHYVNWPVVFIGLGTAIINIGYTVYQDWQRNILMRMLEDDGYMEQIEKEADAIAQKLLDKIGEENDEI